MKDVLRNALKKTGFELRATRIAGVEISYINDVVTNIKVQVLISCLDTNLESVSWEDVSFFLEATLEGVWVQGEPMMFFNGDYARLNRFLPGNPDMRESVYWYISTYISLMSARRQMEHSPTED